MESAWAIPDDLPIDPQPVAGVGKKLNPGGMDLLDDDDLAAKDDKGICTGRRFVRPNVASDVGARMKTLPLLLRKLVKSGGIHGGKIK